MKIETVKVSDNIEIEYSLSGAESEDTLLFVHGLGSNLRQFELQQQYFTKNYRVLLISLRGHGNSSSPVNPTRSDYTVREMTRDVQALLAHLGIILMVDILEQDVSYYPFFPSANLNVLFSYSSNGNTSYFEALKRGDSPVYIMEHKGLFIEGQQQLTDDTRGIISLRAYQNHLADEVAKDILLKLRSDYKLV